MATHTIGNTTIPGFYRFDEAMDVFAGTVFESASSTILVADNLDGTFTRITGSGLTYSGPLNNLTLTGGTITLLERTNSNATSGGTIYEAISGISILATTFQTLMTSGLSINYLFPALFNGTDLISGGDLNDTLFGFDSSDIIQSNNGNDSISGSDSRDDIAGGSGADTIDGGNGFDVLWYYGSGVSVSLLSGTGSGNDAQGDIFSNMEGIVSTTNADYLIGSSDNDYFYAKDGNDILIGNAGNDTIFGAEGRDDIDGGSGNDYLDGGTGFDYAWYETAATTLNLYLGTGSGEAAGDTLTGIEGIVASGGNDFLHGDDNGNHFYGGEGSNTLQGNGGNDTLIGGSVRDDLSGGAGSDYLVGNDDTDFAWYNNGAITIDLVAGTGSGGDATGDILSSIEGISATNNADSISGDTQDNFFIGRSGEDTLLGAGGNDTLDGGDDNDSINGGSAFDLIIGGNGIDTLFYSNNGAITVNLSTGLGVGGDANGDIISEIENIIGTTANDVLIGNVGNNVLYGGLGYDALTGGDGSDTLYGGEQRDDMMGSAGSDSLDGGNGFDYIWFTGSAAVSINLDVNIVSGGDAAGDTIANFEGIVGSSNNDTMQGDDSVNFFYGGGGADLFISSEGNDTLSGGTDADNFFYHGALGDIDLIIDWTTGQDILTLRQIGFSDLSLGGLGADRLVLSTTATQAFGQLLFDTTNGNLFWDGDGTGSGAAVQFLTLQGITTLSPSDFSITP